MEYDQVKELDLIAAYEDKNVEALYGTALKLQATALLLLRHQQEGAVPAVPPRVGTDSTESSRGSWEGCSQQWVQAEHEYPTDYESSTLCWGSKSGVEVWVYDAEKKTSSIRALSDLEDKRAIFAMIPSRFARRLYLSVERITTASVSARSHKPVRYRVTAERRPTSAMTPHRTIYLWDLDLAARLKVLSRKVRWVFILNVVGSSGPGEGHEKATAAGY